MWGLARQLQLEGGRERGRRERRGEGERRKRIHEKDMGYIWNTCDGRSTINEIIHTKGLLSVHVFVLLFRYWLRDVRSMWRCDGGYLTILTWSRWCQPESVLSPSGPSKTVTMIGLAMLKPTSFLPSRHQWQEVFITQVAPTIVVCGVSILRVSMMKPLHGAIFSSVKHTCLKWTNRHTLKVGVWRWKWVLVPEYEGGNENL